MSSEKSTGYQKLFPKPKPPKRVSLGFEEFKAVRLPYSRTFLGWRRDKTPEEIAGARQRSIIRLRKSTAGPPRSRVGM